jgi:hypothetical protein
MKTRVRVYNQLNGSDRLFRNWNLFWERLTERLGTIFDVEDRRVCEREWSGSMLAHLDAATSGPLHVQECEYVVENAENGEFCVLSAADVLTPALMYEKANPKLKRGLISQYVPEGVKLDAGPFFHKYGPWIYFPMGNLDLDVWYFLRKAIPKLVDKMYFRGSTGSRPIMATSTRGSSKARRRSGGRRPTSMRRSGTRSGWPSEASGSESFATGRSSTWPSASRSSSSSTSPCWPSR